MGGGQEEMGETIGESARGWGGPAAHSHEPGAYSTRPRNRTWSQLSWQVSLCRNFRLLHRRQTWPYPPASCAHSWQLLLAVLAIVGHLHPNGSARVMIVVPRHTNGSRHRRPNADIPDDDSDAGHAVTHRPSRRNVPSRQRLHTSPEDLRTQ